MAPRLQMRIAIAMMCVGICPFLSGVAWAVTALSHARHHAAAIAPASSNMFAVLVGSYAFALVVSGGGTLLSFRAEKLNAVSLASAGALRIVVAVVLALPVFLYTAIRLPSI